MHTTLSHNEGGDVNTCPTVPVTPSCNPLHLRPRLRDLYGDILYLWNLDGRHEPVRAHDAYFATRRQRSESTIRRALLELSALGLIRIERNRFMRRLIFIVPLPCAENAPKSGRKRTGIRTKTAQSLPMSESNPDSDSQQQPQEAQPLAVVTDALPTPATPVAAVREELPQQEMPHPPDVLPQSEQPQTAVDVVAFRAWIDAEVPIEKGGEVEIDDFSKNPAQYQKEAMPATFEIEAALSTDALPPIAQRSTTPQHPVDHKSTISRHSVDEASTILKPPLDAALIAALMAEGIDAPAARRLVATDAAECRRQLHWWGQREARGPGLLIRAIEGRYGAPGGKSGGAGGVGPTQGVTMDSGQYKVFVPPQRGEIAPHIPIDTQALHRQCLRLD